MWVSLAHREIRCLVAEGKKKNELRALPLPGFGVLARYPDRPVSAFGLRVAARDRFSNRQNGNKSDRGSYEVTVQPCTLRRFAGLPLVEKSPEENRVPQRRPEQSCPVFARGPRRVASL